MLALDSLGLFFLRILHKKIVSKLCLALLLWQQAYRYIIRLLSPPQESTNIQIRILLHKNTAARASWLKQYKHTSCWAWDAQLLTSKLAKMPHRFFSWTQIKSPICLCYYVNKGWHFHMKINISVASEALLWTQWTTGKEDSVIWMGFHLVCNFTHLIFSSSDDLKRRYF